MICVSLLDIGMEREGQGEKNRVIGTSGDRVIG
jgi:hypothetical protein